MKIPAVLLTLCAPLLALAAPSLKLTAEVKGFASPESVAWDGTHYYVSNVGKELQPMEKDGDGFISRMDADGKNLELKFIGGLNAPKGMVVVGKTLYVCDVGVLLGFNLADGKKTFEVSFAKDGAKFINDVCAAGEGKLLVSATDVNKVYLVDTKEKSQVAIEFDKAPNGPNGLAITTFRQETQLAVAEWGADNQPNGTLRLYSLDAALRKAEEMPPGADFPMKNGFLDGVAVLFKDGKPAAALYSDWVDFKPGGKLMLVLPGDEIKLVELTVPNGPVGGPADFHWVEKTATLALPCMLDGRVLLLKLTLP